MNIPKPIITICASMRHLDLIKEAILRLEAAGATPCFPNLTSAAQSKPWSRLTQEHLWKIDQSDAVLFINPDGHLGTSCTGEFFHAAFNARKPIYFTERATEESLNLYCREIVPLDQIEDLVPLVSTAQKSCDHRSVGLIVYREDKILLIERMKFPVGIAAPAGHLDHDLDFVTAGLRELWEETGLIGSNPKLLLDTTLENPCRRWIPNDKISWHHWQILRVDGKGEPNRSLAETKNLFWASPEEVQFLAERTDHYLSRNISAEEWIRHPGFEPVWHELLKRISL